MTPLSPGDNDRRVKIEWATRKEWRAFPDVLIVQDEVSVRRHQEYGAAKAGDIGAAKRLAAAFVTNEHVERLNAIITAYHTKHGAAIQVRIVPVHAIEAEGINRIPAAFGELLGERLGLEVETGVVQTNIVGHTGASGWWRLAHPPLFDGAIAAGAAFLLLDDFIGQGGTLANLRGHIVKEGGETIGAATLTGKGYSATLALRADTLTALRAKHGPELEDWWRKTFGYGFDALTESEARYLLRAENADAVRDRILEARSPAKR